LRKISETKWLSGALEMKNISYYGCVENATLKRERERERERERSVQKKSSKCFLGKKAPT
jgi:hypothetical protein